MPNDYINDIIIFISGISSGLFISIAPGTASVILIPVFTLLLGASIYNVIGTSLLIDCIIGLVAGLIFLFRKRVDFQPIIYLGASGVITSIIGSRFTRIAPESNLMAVLGIFLFVIGLNFLINGIQKNLDYINKKIAFRFFRKYRKTSFVILGMIIGFLSGFMGMGSAGIVAIVLVLVFEYEIHTGIGTSLLMMSFIAGAGGISHTFKGEILPNPLIIAGLGAVIGSFSGALFANKIDEEKLGKIIGLIIVVFGFVLIFKAFF